MKRLKTISLILLLLLIGFFSFGAKLYQYPDDPPLNSEIENIYLDSTSSKKRIAELEEGTTTLEERITALEEGIKVKIGSFASESSTGNKSYTGIGFKPRYVELWIAISNSTEIRVGRGWMDYNGNQGAISWAGKDDTQVTYLSTGKCFEIRYAINGVLQISAAYVSMDSDGFTINYTTALSSAYTIMYKAVR